MRAMVHRRREIRLLDAFDNFVVSCDCADFAATAGSEMDILVV